MPLFSYKGIDLTGRTHTGELDAADRKSAVQKLGTQGIRPLSLTQKDKPAVADVDETGRTSSPAASPCPSSSCSKATARPSPWNFSNGCSFSSRLACRWGTPCACSAFASATPS